MSAVVEAPPIRTQYIKTRSHGPVPAKILIIGEAPGAEEEVRGIPFVGSSGQELDRMLNEVGISRSECFLTNVCKYRPPENKIEYFFLDSKQTKPNELILEGIAEAKLEIAACRPLLILAMGGTALWALTGNKGITKWRGSMLEYEYAADDGSHHRALLMPTYHPALILREWAWRSIAMLDLRRAKEALDRGAWPGKEKEYIVRPSFTTVMDCLGDLIRNANERQRNEDHPLPISSDLETRAGHIACSGIAWSRTRALCIPNMCIERPTGYFTLDEDVAIWVRERELLTHQYVEVVGANYLYDAQYFARRRGYVPRLRHDTRLMQHCLWPGLPQSLAFVSSMYNQHYVFWKEDGKNWDPKVPEDVLWSYNCDDTTNTLEAHFALLDGLWRAGLYHLYRFQMRMFWSILRMMLRGVRMDQLLRSQIATQLMQASQERQGKLDYILGRHINLQSNPQVHALFYSDLQCKVVKHKKTKRPTCDEDALKVFCQREPLLRPIVELITEIRSIDSLMSNVVLARTPDGRIRSQFSPTAETFRWTSSKDAWDDGTNLQNWTKGDEEE